MINWDASAWDPLGSMTPFYELMQSLEGKLREGVFWTRADFVKGERYELHFTVLHVVTPVKQTKILVYDGFHAGEIITIHQLEASRWHKAPNVISYWPVMDDEIDRVRFTPTT